MTSALSHISHSALSKLMECKPVSFAISTASTGRAFRGLLGATCASIAAASMAAVGTNYSDQWWNAAESGWGASILQQSDLLFVDLLVYGTDGAPIWFTSAASRASNAAAGHDVYSGDLYRTGGPFFGSAFNPGSVSNRKVGTLTFDASSTDNASLSYSVDGTVVAKSVTRQLWKFEDFSGNYQGGFVYEVNPLHGPCIGRNEEQPGSIAVSQSKDDGLTITAQFINGSCTFSGNYSQAGHMGVAQGVFTCADGGEHGSFTAFEMERTASGMTGRIVAESALCEYRGRFGGVLR
jgi:hypothetical protein